MKRLTCTVPLAAVLLAGTASCTRPHPARPYVATIAPLAFIAREIVGDSDSVAMLLPPGASPHTYEPRPSDLTAVSSSRALLYVSPLLDQWAAGFPARRIETIALVPPRLRLPAGPDTSVAAVSNVDPHFWTDPVTVLGMLPALVDTLCAIDSARCSSYRGNAARFADSLRALDRELATELMPLRGRAVVLFHPSMRYLLTRYGIDIVGEIEPSPGQEPSARGISELAATIRRTGATVLYTEPQLPRRPAEVLAELAHVRLDELDPLGGEPGRDSYAALVRYNAGVLLRSLR